MKVFLTVRIQLSFYLLLLVLLRLSAQEQPEKYKEIKFSGNYYERIIRLWQRLPVRLTQYFGPSIVRGIP